MASAPASPSDFLQFALGARFGCLGSLLLLPKGLRRLVLFGSAGCLFERTADLLVGGEALRAKHANQSGDASTEFEYVTFESGDARILFVGASATRCRDAGETGFMILDVELLAQVSEQDEASPTHGGPW